MRVSSKERVIEILENKYEGFKVIEWDNDDPAKMRISAEDGLTDRNGDYLFDKFDNSDKYTFGVVSHLYRWLQRKGWTPEWINNGEIHLWKRGHYGW